MRRSGQYPMRDRAERAFAWRADVMVPAAGFGQAINLMAEWCERQLGPFGGRHEEAGRPGGAALLFSGPGGPRPLSEGGGSGRPGGERGGQAGA